MNTKEKELERIVKDKADLEAKRAQFHKEHSQAQAAIEEHQRKLAADMIAGRPSDKTIEAIASEQIRVKGLAEADTQLAVMISELEAQRTGIERELAIEKFEQETAANRKDLLECVRLLETYSARMDKLIVKPPPVGYRPSKTAVEARNVWDHLRENFNFKHLNEMARVLPDFMIQVRQEKGE